MNRSCRSIVIPLILTIIIACRSVFVDCKGDALFDCPEKVSPNHCFAMNNANWMMVFDLAYPFATTTKRDQVYQIFIKITDNITSRMNQSMNFHSLTNFHQLGLLISLGGGRILPVRSICDKRRALGRLKFPQLNDENLTDLIGPEESFAQVDRIMQNRRCRQEGVQDIIMIFSTTLSPQSVQSWHNITGFLNQWRNHQSNPRQVYIVYVSEMDDLLTNFYSTLEPNLVHGAFFINLTATNLQMTHDAELILYCACATSEDCRFSTVVWTTCYFANVQTSNDSIVREQCIKRQTFTYYHHVKIPKGKWHRRCPVEDPPGRLQCSNISECQSDCASKGWTEWSPCVKTDQGEYFETKIRRKPNNGFSEFTVSCPWNKTRNCRPSTTLEPGKPMDEIVIICVMTLAIVTFFVFVTLTIIFMRRSKIPKIPTELAAAKSEPELRPVERAVSSTTSRSKSKGSLKDEKYALLLEKMPKLHGKMDKKVPKSGGHKVASPWLDDAKIPQKSKSARGTSTDDSCRSLKTGYLTFGAPKVEKLPQYLDVFVVAHPSKKTSSDTVKVKRRDKNVKVTWQAKKTK